MAREKSWRLRSYLTVFAAALALPPIVLAAVATTYFAGSERSRLEAIVDKANADVWRTIEASLGGDISMLRALATSSHLVDNDFKAFDKQARAVAELQDVTIVLTDLNRQQLVNTFAPFGTPLPKSNDIGVFSLGSGPKAAYVSNLFEGALSGRKILRVVVPVTVGNATRYYLSATVSPKSLSTTHRESLDDGPYFATILDRNGVIAGRSIGEDQFVGRPLKALADSAAGGAPRGVWEGVNPQGIPIFVYWRRSPTSGWIVATGISEAALHAPLNRSLVILAAITVAILLIAYAFALWLGRKVTEAQNELVRLAEVIDSGRVLEPPLTPLIVSNTVGQAISHASRRLGEQGQTIARAQEELERKIERRTRELAIKTGRAR